MRTAELTPDDILHGKLCRRAIVLSAVFTGCFSLLGWRLVNLQIFQGDRFKQAAEAERLRKIDLPAQRGPIYDRHGEMLAFDRRVFSVVVDRHLLRDVNSAIRTLASTQGVRPGEVPRLFSEEEMRRAGAEQAIKLVAPKLGLSPEALRNLIGDNAKGEVILAKDLTDDQAQPLKDLIEQERIPGVFLRESMKRCDPLPDRAVHVLGFVNSANQGVEGVEKSMNAELSGEDGWRWVERDRRGNETRSKSRTSQEPRDGHGVRLTIQMDLQQIVEHALDETGSDPAEVYLPPIKPERVTVILMDPKTNAILAMANRPDFSLEKREEITSNAAVAETYEPGSTFKVNVYSGSFDRSLVSLNTPMYLNGGHFDKGNVHIRDDELRDTLPVIGCLAHSSNVAAIKLAEQLGATRFYGYMKAFGFGERTGVELPHEAAGRLRSPDVWRSTSLPHIAIGYEVSVTPLQLLNAYSTVINDGVLRKPRLVDAILSPDGTIIETRESEVVRRVCSAQAARNFRRCLCEVVKSGTGRQAAIPGYDVAGKTGTAKKWNPKAGPHGSYPSDSFIVSFVGYVPAENPSLLGIVIVDDPKVESGREFGALIAAPVFRRICARALECLHVPPNPELLARAAAASEARRPR